MKTSLIPEERTSSAFPLGHMPWAPTARFNAWLVLGALLILPAFWKHQFLYGLAAWDTLLVFIGSVDLARTPKPHVLSVTRHWRTALALGETGGVDLTFRNDSQRELICLAIDEVPAPLSAKLPRCQSLVPALFRTTESYEVAPSERGEIEVGSVFLRYRTRVGLVERRAKVDLTQKVKVYPKLHAEDSGVLNLARNRRLELQRRLDRQRGMGREFESLREYREGDEFRDICWTATARRAKLVTKVQQAERSQSVWVVLDCGRLMQARSAALTNLDYSTDTALRLAQLVLASGDKVGLLAYSRNVNVRLSPARGAEHLRVFLEALSAVKTVSAEANHLRAASLLQQNQRRRSLIIWITEMSETAGRPEVVEAAMRLARHHAVLFVTMRQRSVEEVASQLPNNTDHLYFSTAAEEMLQRRRQLLASLRERGAHTLDIAHGELSSAVLNAYLRIKEQGVL